MTQRRPIRRAAIIGGGLGLAVLATGIAVAVIAPSDNQSSSTGLGTTETLVAKTTPAVVLPAETPDDLTLSLDGLDANTAAQLEYVLANWDNSYTGPFGYIEEFNCMNFTSQTLLARGWEQTEDWWNDQTGDPLDASTSWYSSTAFMDWLSEHPELATPLTDDERDELAVGDIVQFDWDNSGDRDHTGIVTRIDHNADGTISVYYAGHTDYTLMRSVDWAVTVLHPGGTAHYWHLS